MPPRPRRQYRLKHLVSVLILRVCGGELEKGALVCKYVYVCLEEGHCAVKLDTFMTLFGLGT